MADRQPMTLGAEKYITRGGSRQSVGYVIVNASIIVAVCLTALLIVHDISENTGLRLKSYLAFGSIAYLFSIRWLLNNNRVALAHWFIIGLFGAIGLTTIFFWGIDTASGILTLGFVLILPGVLLGAKKMPLIFGIIAGLLLIIQGIHQFGIFTPDTSHYSESIVYEDVVAYIIILAIFSLVIWLSLRRAEFAFNRARRAEQKLRKQKGALKVRLAQESAKLRTNQQKEVQQLHSFAVLGQNTAATLHELSNHLAVLGMDIEGLRDTHRHSKAVADAHESFRQVTAMVKTIRRQLNQYNPRESVAITPTIKDTVRDLRTFIGSAVSIKLRIDTSVDPTLTIHLDPITLNHILTILIKNAAEACNGFPKAIVAVCVVQTKSTLRITVSDNGLGIPESLRPSLFSPVTSSKPTGLGAGLFIAKNLTKTQLGGTLRLIANGKHDQAKRYLGGATFALEIPLDTRS